MSAASTAASPTRRLLPLVSTGRLTRAPLYVAMG